MSWFGGKSRTGSNLIQFLGGQKGFFSRGEIFNGIMNAMSGTSSANIAGVRGHIGTATALSSSATFSALGGEWTLGDLSPVLWMRAGEGITVGGTSATIAATAAWTTNGTSIGAEGDWTRIDNTAPSVEHYAQGGLTNSLTALPVSLTIHVRRGAPPAAEVSNILRIYPALKPHYLDIDLDSGTVAASSGAEDVVLDNATIAAGAPVKINSATYTAPV